jgi:hypothetical protein
MHDRLLSKICTDATTGACMPRSMFKLGALHAHLSPACPPSCQSSAIPSNRQPACPPARMSASPFAGHPKYLPAGQPAIPTARHPHVRTAPCPPAYLMAIPNACLPWPAYHSYTAGRSAVRTAPCPPVCLSCGSSHSPALKHSCHLALCLLTCLSVSSGATIKQSNCTCCSANLSISSMQKCAAHFFRRFFLIKAWCNLFITLFLPPTSIILCRFLPQSTELTRGPPELVQHFCL